MRVRIFRNLTRNAWSIQTKAQGAWRTVGHAGEVAVINAKFHHSEATRARIVATGSREVHAWVEGDLSAVGPVGLVEKWTDAAIVAAFAAAGSAMVEDRPVGVTYRPFERGGFYVRATGAAVATAPAVSFTLTAGCTV